MTARRNEPITFYIDRCLGAKIIAETLKEAGITVETHDKHFAQNALDLEWLPAIGTREWVVLTKDDRIRKNQLERLAVANAKIKMFILASQSLSGQEMANIFLKALVKMQEFVRKHNAPFIAKIYKNGRIEMWKDHQALLEELQHW